MLLKKWAIMEKLKKNRKVMKIFKYTKMKKIL